MSNLTTISIDRATREQVGKRASADKLSVSAVARMLLADYAAGRLTIGVQVEEPLRAESVAVDADTQALMDNAVRAWRRTNQ